MFKKSLKTVLAVLLLLVTSLFFTACAGKDSFKVTIKDGDTVIETLDSLPSSSSLSKYDKEGYVLEGIYLDGEFAEKFDEKAYGELQMDITLYLKYEKKSYFITFNTNGGEAIEPIEVKYEEAYTLPTPVKEGYTFTGYTIDGEEFALEGTFTKTNSVKVFANWELNKYAVKFINVNASNAQVGNTLTVEHGSKVSLPQVPLGYQIESGKAYTDEACTKEFDFNSQIKANANLYIKVEPIEYTITINVNGGNAVEPVKVKYNAVPTFPALEKDGYNFVGYTIDGVPFDVTKPYTKTSNITVTANWSIKSYDVKFINVVDNSQLGATLKVNHNGKVSMISYSNPGYELLNGKAYKDVELTQEFIFATETITANTTIYVKVIASTFNITVNQATGVNTTAVYGQEYTINEPTREGFNFVKFTYNGEDFSATGTYNYTTDIVITAVWEAIPGFYNRDVFFYDGETELESLRREVTIGDVVYANGLPSPQKAGYEFNGWYLDKDLTSKVTENITVADDVKLYAKYTANEYTITIEANGGNAVAPYTATYNADYTLTAPERTGYEFKGYTLNGEEFALNGKYTQVKDITIVAQWEICVYEVKFINVDGNVQVGDTLTIEYNQKASGLPTISTVGSEILNGKAYTNAELTSEFDFNTLITENKTLYIKIVKSVYTITVNSDGGSLVDSKNITYGEEYTLAAPTKNGYKFIQFNNVTTGEKFELSGIYNKTESVNLIAIWEELIVEEGENSTNEEFNLVKVDNKYFKEKKVYDEKSEYKYVLFRGQTYAFNDMTVSSKDAGALATISNNTVAVGNTLGTFTLTITKTVEGTLVTYDRTVQIVENIASFDYGTQYLGRDEANFQTNTVVETLSAGLNNFIPEIVVTNLQDVSLNFADSNMIVTIKNSEGAVIDGGFEYNSTLTGFNFDNGLLGGEYSLEFSPKYVLEDKDVTFKVKFNNGVNVYTNKELKENFKNLAVKEINVLRNITAELDDNQYIGKDKNRGPYASDTLVWNADHTLNFESSTLGSVYGRYTAGTDDSIKVHGNSFKLDASNLPRVDGAYNDSWVTVADQSFAKGKVVNHHAMIFAYESRNPSNGYERYNGNNNFAIDNLAIFGNNTKDDAEVITYNNGENSYYTMSASYNAVFINGGNLTCDNVAVRNSLISIYVDGGLDAKTNVRATTATLNNVYVDNSWANSVFVYNLSDLSVNNSYIGHSGGAAIHFDVFPFENKAQSKLHVDANTQIENWELGSESWFMAYGMGNTGTLIKSLASNCIANHEKGEVFNFAIFYQQKGDNEDWLSTSTPFGIIVDTKEESDLRFYTSIPDKGANIYLKGAELETKQYLNFTHNIGVNVGAFLPIVSQG